MTCMNVTIVLKVFISDENTLFFLVSVGKNGEKLRFPIYYLRITREIASLRDAEVWRWEGFRRRGHIGHRSSFRCFSDILQLFFGGESPMLT